jgi:hypothetical protein
MQKKIIYITFLAITIASLSMSFKRDPKNPPTQNTGAPGEKTCQQSGCHSGGNYAGKVEFTGLPDSVIANEIYFVTITGTSATAVRGGFQMTALNAKTNLMAGSFFTGVNSNIGNASGKQYIRQANYSAYATLGGKVSWTFRWQAPASPMDSIKFYYVTLLANGNGKEGGDNVVQGNKKVFFKKSTASIEADENNTFVKIPSTLVNHTLAVQIPENEGQLWVYDTEGRMMQTQALVADNQIDVSSLTRGVYIAIVKVGDKTVSKRFIKQ